MKDRPKPRTERTKPSDWMRKDPTITVTHTECKTTWEVVRGTGSPTCPVCHKI